MNVQFFAWKKIDSAVCHFENYGEGIRTPIVLALHVNVSECKLCLLISPETIARGTLCNKIAETMLQNTRRIELFATCC